MTATCFDFDLGQRYALYHGDSIEVMPGLPDNSVGLSVSSWPFSDQYAYSDSIADLGNCDGDEQFFTQSGHRRKRRQRQRCRRPGARPDARHPAPSGGNER